MSCELDLVYDDDRWATIISPDQEGCNEYLLGIKDKIKDAKVLHVGTGNSSVFTQFYSSFRELHGITIMDSEIQVAYECILGVTLWESCTYNIFKVNKYDIEQMKQLDSDYDIIIDNNLKQHGCCQEHWEEYFHCLLGKLAINGFILTHSQGFAPHTNRVTALTDTEMVGLISKSYDEYKTKSFYYRQHNFLHNESGKYPITITRQR